MIVGCFVADAMPHAFDGIEFGGIRGEEEYLDALAIGGEPRIDLRFLMVGRIVLDEIDAMPSPVKRGKQCVVQERRIGFRVKVLGLAPIRELARGGAYAPENLLAVALPFGRNARLGIAHGPGLMECRRLAKGGLVFVNHYGVLGAGFFRFGYV